MPEWLKTITEYMDANNATLIINSDGGEFNAALEGDGETVLYSIGGREDMLAALSKVAEWIDEQDD